MIVGGSQSLYDIYSAKNKTKEVVVQAGGWVGAWAGMKAGSITGANMAIIAGQFGPQAVAPEELVTVPVAGAIGGFLGGIGGFLGGTNVTETVYEWIFTHGIMG